MITYLAQFTRDKLGESEKVVNELFFDKIFELMLHTDDERNKLKSFEILCNLINSDVQRAKLSEQDYFRRVFMNFKI